MCNNLEQMSHFVIYLFWVRFTFRWLKVTIVICSFRNGLRDDKYVCKQGAWISFFRKTPWKVKAMKVVIIFNNKEVFIEH